MTSPFTGNRVRIRREDVTVFAGELDHPVAGRIRPGERVRITHPPTRGDLWWQAYAETLPLPSWERQRRIRARYDELVAAAGLL